MSYELKILADAPFSFWKLDGTGPNYTDAAGGSRVAAWSGSNIMSALVTGSGNSIVVGNTTRLEMDDPVFNSGYELRQFTLEAWVKPHSITNAVSIMSHDGIDGLVITPISISFTTSYTSGDCTASYDVSPNKSFHIVGVHTISKNSLYVDGVLVAEEDLSDEQIADSYSFVTTDLIAGISSDSSKISIDAPAIYIYPMSADIVQAHHSLGIDVDSSETIASYNNSAYWSFTDSSRYIALSQTWDSAAEWKTGKFSDTLVSEDTIVPSYTQTQTSSVVDGLTVYENHDTSIAGTWIGTLILNSIPESGVTDGRIEYSGVGDFTVEYSINGGTSWFAPSALIGITLTNTNVIDIRVTFGGGVEDDPSYVDYIKVVTYLTKTFKGSRDVRTATLNGDGTCSSTYLQPIEYSDINGIIIDNGSIDISADTSYPDGPEVASDEYINGIDIWIRPVAGNIFVSGSINIIRSGNTVTYSGFSSVTVNGVSVSSGATVFTSDGWYHIGGVLSTPANLAFSIAHDGAHVSSISAIYGSINTAGLIQMYETYLGLPGMTVDDTSTIDIAEFSPATNIYAHVWSINSAG